MSSRKTARVSLRKERNSLSNGQQKKASYNCFQHLTNLPEFRHAKHIASYLASDGELNLHTTVKHLWRQHKAVYLPRITKNFTIRFYHYQKCTLLRANRYGIDEPMTINKRFNCEKFDVILVPLVGFNKHGQRLGMGGGYYDRVLAKLKNQRHRPVIVGIAHSCQYLERIDQQSWDVNMDIIVTEKQIFRCPSFYH